MAPIALFDKSFLQALNIDEAVLFDIFFLPVVCPLFYVETLADLGKEAARPGRIDPESIVSSLAAKTPEMHGAICAHHVDMVMSSLAGQPIPMTGQVPMPQGRLVEQDGEVHAVFDVLPEHEAFERWQNGEFEEVERRFAKQWRDELANLDLKGLATVVDRFGVDPQQMKSLAQVRVLAEHIIETMIPGDQLELALELLAVPEEHAREIRAIWASKGRHPLERWAPYARHVLAVEIFFWLAVRYGKLSSERASHRADIAYLYYLPFCQVFVSNDKLHRECVPFFLRGDQLFVWGQDLKEDLKSQGVHLSALPEDEKQRGLLALAPRPQKGLILDLWKISVPGAIREDLVPEIPEKFREAILARIKAIQAAPGARSGRVPGVQELNSVSMQRRIHGRRGSWFQVPADLPPDAPIRGEQGGQE